MTTSVADRMRMLQALADGSQIVTNRGDKYEKKAGFWFEPDRDLPVSSDELAFEYPAFTVAFTAV